MQTEFFEAIKQGNLDEVKHRLELDPSLVHAKENGLSPVLVAAYHNEPNLANFLADKTVTLTIFEAAATGRTSHIVRLLAHDPGLVNAWTADGFQPLGLACFFGHQETAEYLLKAGAAVNSPSQNPLHATPLHSAAAAGHNDIVRLLLFHNADPDSREQNGYTPLHTAAQNGDPEMIRTLLYGGANLDVRSDDGKLPVDIALEAGKDEAARLLLEGITRRTRTRRRPS